MNKQAKLFIFSGLPATGKTTLSKKLARYLKATHLRIDTIEQGIRDLCQFKVEGEGYRLAYRIATDNLNLGLNVVADSCNPINLTRDEWQQVAKKSNAKYINIEVICSNTKIHKNRVNSRTSDIVGLNLPDWSAVENRQFDPWESERIVLDTSNLTVEESFKELLTSLKAENYKA